MPLDLCQDSQTTAKADQSDVKECLGDCSEGGGKRCGSRGVCDRVIHRMRARRKLAKKSRIPPGKAFSTVSPARGLSGLVPNEKHFLHSQGREKIGHSHPWPLSLLKEARESTPGSLDLARLGRKGTSLRRYWAFGANQCFTSSPSK